MLKSLRTLALVSLVLPGAAVWALPPVATPSIATVNAQEDMPLADIDLSAVFTDPDAGDELTYSVVSESGDLAYSVSVDSDDGEVEFTNIPNISGTQTIVFEARDLAGETAQYTLTINVAGNDDTPVAQNDSATIDELDLNEDGSVIIDVLANDDVVDLPATITIYGVNWPDDVNPQFTNVSESTATTQVDEGGIEFTVPNGYLALLPDNTIEYTPKANYSGLDFFSYTVEDADGQQTTATVTVDVIADNDPPRVWGTYEYTVNQGSFLSVDETLGLLSQTIDDDGDAMQITLITPPSVGNLSLDATTGAFTYTPPATYGSVGDPPVTFVVQYNDLPIAGDDSSATATVTVDFDPDEGDGEPSPPGEVEQIFDLADVPLEDAISAESNVLVVMDDSGSMDWSIMVPGPGNMMNLNNTPFKQGFMRSRAQNFAYTHQLATNQYTSWYYAIPTQEALDAHPKFQNEGYGVWRAWSSAYNPIYYNPEVYYEPWTGIARNGDEFPNANPSAAVLDPFDTTVRTIDLTAENLSYQSRYVPSTFNDSNGWEHVTNSNVHMAHYYTTTAPEGTLPNANQMGQRVDIRANYTLNDGTVLTSYPGGPARVDCAEDDDDPLTCTYAQEIQNFANWFTYYRSREYTAKAALGRAISGASNLRMGYTVLNKTNEREAIESLNASYRVGHKKELLDQMYSVWSGGGTPLRRALDRAGRTFECVSGNAFFNSGGPPGSANCPVLAAPEGQCQNNFTLLFSDGEWNGSFSISNHDNDATGGNSSTPFDGGVFQDNFSSTLADVAMYYYERDLHPDLTDGVATTERDQQYAPTSAFDDDGEIMHQHMKTFTVGFGLEGNFTLADIPTDYTQPFNWPAPWSSTRAKIDDMLHAAINGRGQFLQANNPVLLTQVFQTAFEEFSDSSVSVSAVAFNSTALREETVEYRGFFNPKFHNGDLRALSVDASTGIVDNANPIWSAAAQMDNLNPTTRVVVTYDDITERGKPFTYAQLNADQLSVLNQNELDWLRGDRSNEEPNGILRSRQQDSGLLGDIVHSAPVFVGAPRAFRRDQEPYPTNLSDQYSQFVSDNANRQRVVYVGANDGMLHGFDAGTPGNTGTGDEIVAFVPNKIIDSSEQFANRLDQLTSLVYAHRFFVDLTPTVEDVFMPASWAAASKSWNTILVGGLGAGGKGYYAMNVTDPGDYSSATAASDTVLWEFTDEDDTYPVDGNGDPITDDDGNTLLYNGMPVKDLGYALAQPQVVMTNVNDTDSEKQWGAVFGNGYNSTAGIAKLFVLFVGEGMDGWSSNDFVKIDTGEGVKGAPDPLAGLPNGIGTVAVVDADGNGTADYAYGGDLFGNMFRFDMTSTNPDDWSATKIFQATLDGTTSTRQPVTTQPYVIKFTGQQSGEPDEGFLVVFGTGSWVTDDDGTSTEVQSVYGIWDRLEVNPNTASPGAKFNRLVEQNITNIVDEGALFPNQRILSKNVVAYQPDSNTGTPGTYGWYFDLDPVRASVTLQGNPSNVNTGLAPPSPQFPGERAIRRIIERGGILLITTVIPRDANTCFRAPPGSTFPIDALTGGNPTRPFFDTNNDGVIDDDDLVVVAGETYTSGVLFDADDLDGTVVDPSMLVGTGDHDYLFISGGDDQITLRIAPPEDQKTGRLSWRQLLD